jgi:hypothetical protein
MALLLDIDARLTKARQFILCFMPVQFEKKAARYQYPSLGIFRENWNWYFPDGCAVLCLW